MIWLSMPHVEQPTRNKLSSICHEKLLEKDLSVLYGVHYAIAPLENYVGYMLPQYLQGSADIEFDKKDCMTE